MRYFRALTLSLVLHTVLVLLALWLTPPVSFAPKRTGYVDLLESPELPRRPKQESTDAKTFVRNTEVPKELLSNQKKPTDFASEDERFVVEETKARNNGMTANRSAETAQGLPGVASQAPDASDDKTAKRDKGKGKLDLAPETPLERMENGSKGSEGIGDVVVDDRPKPAPDGSRPLVFPNFGVADRGVSTVGEALPDSIKFGDLTVLNTDRHLYYAFYARMEESIRNRWVSYARAVLYSYATGARRLTGGETWTTRLEVILDEQGNFKRAVLRESSGIKGLDAAPVQAFRDAQQFPNPPREMIKDGEITVMYAFAVNVIPSYAQSGDD